MSQWHRVTHLCKTNSAVREKVSELYGRFPSLYRIRIQFSAWFEGQDWNADNTSDEGKQNSNELLQQLLQAISQTIEATQLEESYDKIMDLEIYSTHLKKEYEKSSWKFVDLVRQILQEERALIDSIENEPDELKHRGRAGRPVENIELNAKLDALKDKLDAASFTMAEADRKQEEFLRTYQKKMAQAAQIGKPGQIGSTPTGSTSTREMLQAQVAQLAAENFQRRNAMVKTHIDLAIDLATRIKMIWEDILKWQMEQRLAITGLAQYSENSLDILDKLCDKGASLLHRMIGQVENAISLCSKASYPDDTMKRDLERVLIELRDDYLPSFLCRTIVVEQNIPDRTLIISGQKKRNFSMSVRQLGGKALGLGFNKSIVKLSVFSEADIPSEDVYAHGICDIENGNERPFVVNTVCVARFHSLCLRNFKRTNPRGTSDELVTEQKYAFVFYTTFNICGKTFPVKVVSLPVIFISQTSQEIMSKGTLVWDAAFSEELRKPYVYKDKARWCEVAALLSAMFVMNTGRGLTPDQLRYLAKIVFKSQRNDIDFALYPVTEKQIIRDRLPKQDFSFWKWVMACMYLVKEVLIKEWTDGLIHGFVSREDARLKLIDKECGTFLLRFSESSIEKCQKANIYGFLTLVVVELDPLTGNNSVFHVRNYMTSEDIKQRGGLHVILDAMHVKDSGHTGRKQLLKYLWPAVSTPFQTAFAITGDLKKVDDGYEHAKLIIEISLSNPDYGPGGRDGCTDIYDVSRASVCSSGGVASPLSMDDEDESVGNSAPVNRSRSVVIGTVVPFQSGGHIRPPQFIPPTAATINFPSISNQQMQTTSGDWMVLNEGVQQYTGPNQTQLNEPLMLDISNGRTPISLCHSRTNGHFENSMAFELHQTTTVLPELHPTGLNDEDTNGSIETQLELAFSPEEMFPPSP